MLGSIIIGIHLVSLHVPAEDFHNNQNWGLYARTESGWAAGGFRNTLDRNSFYLAKSWERGNWSLTLGAISGYQKEMVQEAPKGQNGQCADGNAPPCMVERGKFNGAIGPLVAISYAMPKMGSITPRLSLIPPVGSGDATTLHLSVEF